MELWQVVAAIIGLLVTATGISFTVALKSFGGAFRHWGDKFDSFQRGVNKRLDHIEATVATRLSAMESKFDRSDEKYHRLTLHVERRVTWLEATAKTHHDKGSTPPISPESPLVARSPWYSPVVPETEKDPHE